MLYNVYCKSNKYNKYNVKLDNMDELKEVVYVTEKNKNKIKILKAQNDLKREDDAISMLLNKYLNIGDKQ